ncbi:hypothetical protein ACM9HF_05615 [Colwellia sp. RE-S-Sl-9]
MIKALPCFVALHNPSSLIINRIEAGQSSLCFEVKHDDKSYFVKYNDNLSFFENELKTSKAASHIALSPRVIYAANDWLVNEFVYGETLDRSGASMPDKIGIALDLMKQCHSLKVTLPLLNITKIITRIVNNSCFSNVQKDHIQALLCKLPTPFGNNYVVCHSDINFSNIIMANSRAWLIDFECACLAEKEFEIAMFFAINLLTADEQSYALKVYQALNPNEGINIKSLNTYLLYSYLLNGLWYIEKVEETMNESKIINFRTLAAKQFHLFDLIWPSEMPLKSIMR